MGNISVFNFFNLLESLKSKLKNKQTADGGNLTSFECHEKSELVHLFDFRRK